MPRKTALTTMGPKPQNPAHPMGVGDKELQSTNVGTRRGFKIPDDPDNSSPSSLQEETVELGKVGGDLQDLIEWVFQVQWQKLENLLRHEIDTLPDRLVDRLAAEQNKGVLGKFQSAPDGVVGGCLTTIQFPASKTKPDGSEPVVTERKTPSEEVKPQVEKTISMKKVNSMKVEASPARPWQAGFQASQAAEKAKREHPLHYYCEKLCALKRYIPKWPEKKTKLYRRLNVISK